MSTVGTTLEFDDNGGYPKSWTSTTVLGEEETGVRLFLGPEHEPSRGRWKTIGRETPQVDLERARKDVYDEIGAGRIVVHEYKRAPAILFHVFEVVTADHVVGALMLQNKRSAPATRAFIAALGEAEPGLRPERWPTCFDEAYRGTQRSFKEWAKQEIKAGHMGRLGEALAQLKPRFIDFEAVIQEMTSDPMRSYVKIRGEVHKIDKHPISEIATGGRG